MYLLLYCQGSKRVTQGFTVRGSWRPNKDCNILTPLLWPSVLCLSHSPDAQPGSRGLSFLLSAGFLYHILSPTGLQNYWGAEGPFGREWLSLPHLVSDVSDPQLIRAPRAPAAGLSLPHLISNFSGSQLISGPKDPLRRAFSTTTYQQLLWIPTV